MFTLALVNNMPDAAFVDTEGQFRHALASAGMPDDVRFELYTITEIVRSSAITAVIDERYRGLDALWSDPPDALVVTGTEPAQAQLAYEPYWPYLARLLQWAADAVPTTMLSCLAAHASILLFDAIDRVALPSKLSGVFTSTVLAPEDPLMDGLPAQVPIPHSRLNDVPQAALERAGYTILMGSQPADGAPGAGWSVAAKQIAECRFVLCQGHPEYSPVSLLREYRRDVRRSVFGRGAIPYPPMPEGYLDAVSVRVLGEYAERVEHVAQVEGDLSALWAAFPYDVVAPSITHPWADAAARLYANWLGHARAAAVA